jgi:iron complex outermembrane recepter protein
MTRNSPKYFPEIVPLARLETGGFVAMGYQYRSNPRATARIPNGWRRRFGPLERVTSVTAAVLTALHGPIAMADDADSGMALQEVVVTATRRAESAQDIPLSITAVTGADLDASGIEDISALAHSIAGINYTDKGPFGGVNGANLIIRGLNSETTSGLPAAASPVVPPVSTYVDDTPLFVNLRLQDLDRVEILRGPQGTLYGSGSLGGTIRFVQNAPDPTAFDAKAEAGLSDTAHTSRLNEEVNGMLNLPLSDTFAVRMNASYTYDAGFINAQNLYVLDATGAPVSAQPGNLFSPPETYTKNGTNAYDYRSARIAALWKPSAEFHAQLSYYYQLSTADGYPYAATSTAAFNQPISPSLQPTGNFTNPALATQLYNASVPAGVDSLSNAQNALDTTNDEVNVVALTLEYDMGFATFISATSYAHHVNQTYADETGEYENFSFYQSLYGQNPRTFVIGLEGLNDQPWSQEFRLASKLGGTFDWVGGLFYKNQTTDIREHDFYPGYNSFYNGCQAIYGQSAGNGVTPSYCGVGETAYTANPTTVIDGIPILQDQAYVGDFETKFTDLAAFGELTAHLTPAWSLTGGTRVFKQTVTQAQQTGLLFDGSEALFGPVVPIANISLSDEWRKALWKVNTAYQLDKSNLVYATWSEGFRRGGVNALPASEPGEGYVTPPALTKLQPDTADNYEIGIKGTLESRFRYSAALYDIQWHNIQEGLDLTPLVLPASLNIGEAFSRGLELETDALLTRHLTASLDYTYDQTKLTSINPLFVFPNASAPPPALGSPLPGTPKTSLAGGFELGHVELAGGEWRYAINAHYQSSLIPALSATVPTVAGYTMLETRLSYALPHFITTVYVNNLTNNLGITSYQDPGIFGNRYQALVSQPRTIGITFAYSFSGR